MIDRPPCQLARSIGRLHTIVLARPLESAPRLPQRSAEPLHLGFEHRGDDNVSRPSVNVGGWGRTDPGPPIPFSANWRRGASASPGVGQAWYTLIRSDRL